MDSRDAVLAGLLEAGEEFISGQALGEGLHISRAAVHRHIDSLRAEGYEIQSVRNRGYRIISIPDRFDPPRILSLLTTRALGRAVRCLNTVDSTNRYLKGWAEEGAPHGALVLCEEQTAGSGRYGRRWLARPGMNVMMSILLRPDMLPGEVQKVTLAVAAAVSGAIEAVCPDVRTAIKWPNDVLINGRKVCGILTELSATAEGIRWIIVGIGVNVLGSYDDLPGEIRETAAILAQACGRNPDRSRLAAEICNHFERLWEDWTVSGSFAGVLNVYRGHMAFLDEPVRLTLGKDILEGVLRGVDDEGLLLIDTPGGTVPVRSGEVTLRRNEG